MEFNHKVKDMVLNAEAKALATNGPHGLNVVSVSTVDIEDDKIILVDYFMKKTKENFLEYPHASLACWKALSGYQIQGTVEYKTRGEKFEEIKRWAKTAHPERTVHGYISFTPEVVYDISTASQ